MQEPTEKKAMASAIAPTAGAAQLPPAANLPPAKADPDTKVVCAWCDRIMGTKGMQVPPEFRGKATHSICSECREKHFGHLKKGAR